MYQNYFGCCGSTLVSEKDMHQVSKAIRTGPVSVLNLLSAIISSMNENLNLNCQLITTEITLEHAHVVNILLIRKKKLLCHLCGFCIQISCKQNRSVESFAITSSIFGVS